MKKHMYNTLRIDEIKIDSLWITNPQSEKNMEQICKVLYVLPRYDSIIMEVVSSGGSNPVGMRYDVYHNFFGGFKPKKNTIWINIYDDAMAFKYVSKEVAEFHAMPSRVACIEVEYNDGEGL